MLTLNNLTIYESVDEYPWECFTNMPVVSNRRKSYIDVIVTFDTETTTLRRKEADKWVAYGAFVYSYQFAINGIPCILRTQNEYLAFRRKMHEVLEVSSARNLMVFVHNLGYDLEMVKDITPYDYDNMLAYANHHIFNIKTLDNEEWRCSYKLSNMSLAVWTAKMGVAYPKQEDFDYDLVRHSATALEPNEKYYMACDVVGLYGCLKEHMRQHDETLATLKLTSTSYPRAEVVNAALSIPGYRKNIFRRAGLTTNTYKYCRCAFRGGNTHGSQMMIGEIISGVKSRDIASSYPYQLMARKYPMSRFVKEGGCKTERHIEALIKSDKALLLNVAFAGLRLKSYSTPVPYLSVSKCTCDKGTTYVFNGRVLKSGMCITFITDIDYAIISDMYDWDSILVRGCYSANYGYLPDKICDVIKANYDYKTTLKDKSKTDELAATLYTKAKNILNGIYGVMATDIVRDNIMYKDGEWKKEGITDKKIRESLDGYYNSWTKALHYQWGVWCTAWARKSLQEAIDIVGPYNFIYCDTDSVKYIPTPEIERVFDTLNERIQANAESRNAYSDYNGKRYYMGIFDDEGTYDRFITLGAKRYAYEKDGTLHVTVSGVPTKRGIGAKVLGKIENFKTGFTWKGEDTGKMAMVYSKEGDLHDWDVVDYKGAVCHMHQVSWVGMLPSDYTLDTAPYTNDYEISYFIQEFKKAVYEKEIRRIV